MWLLGRLYPDHKSIAEFRRMHRDAVTAAGAELVRFARRCGLIRGEWIAIDASKFRAVASVDSTRERLALQRYLDSVEKADEEQQGTLPRDQLGGVFGSLSIRAQRGAITTRHSPIVTSSILTIRPPSKLRSIN